MECSKCGSPIDHVPEHLRDLATWICQKCTNSSVKAQPSVEMPEESVSKQVAAKKKQKAA